MMWSLPRPNYGGSNVEVGLEGEETRGSESSEETNE